MTEYEIWDLRNAVGERNLAMSKFWMTVTFTVYGAAYYMRSDLEIIIVVALTAFYSLTVAINIQGMRQAYDQFDFLAQQLAASTSAQGDGEVAAEGALLIPSKSLRRTQFVMIFIVYLSFFPYVVALILLKV